MQVERMLAWLSRSKHERGVGDETSEHNRYWGAFIQMEMYHQGSTKLTKQHSTESPQVPGDS